MKYRQIIHTAWELTTKNKPLLWFVFIPSLVAVLVFVAEVSWQLYLYLGEFGKIDHHISMSDLKHIYQFLIEHDLLGFAIFALIFILFFTFVVPAWVLGTIGLSLKHQLKTPEKQFLLRLKTLDGIKLFFPLFKLHSVLGIFSFLSIALFFATFYRFFHDTVLTILIPAFIVFSIIAFFVNMFTGLAQFYIICDGEREISESLKKSAGVVFMHFTETLAIMLLMFLVNFRILVNVLIILGVPIGFLIAISYFTSSTAIIISIIVAFLLLCFVAYLTAIVEIFSSAVWIQFYYIAKERKEALEDDV
jgi:hypothetical protein